MIYLLGQLQLRNQVCWNEWVVKLRMIHLLTEGTQRDLIADLPPSQLKEQDKGRMGTITTGATQAEIGTQVLNIKVVMVDRA